VAGRHGYTCHLTPSLRVLPDAIVGALGRDARVHALEARGALWLVERGDDRAALRRSTVGPEVSPASLAWVHRFLADLARIANLGVPKPLPLLDGASLLAAEDAMWETLSFVPGKPLLWHPTVPVESAGAMLARLHVSSFGVSPAEQRPLALPMEACSPSTAPDIVANFHTELEAIGHAAAPRCVIHGDATLANMLVSASGPPLVAGLIDFELAHLGPPESDISFALWVTGRTEQTSQTLDPNRVRAFVRGYHQVRPLSVGAIRAIPLYLVGRGLQMHVRIERRGRADEVQLNRLRWLHTNRGLLEEAVAAALL
jgi:Ser/Thr protein kinase RdoA (MazF antagonist)